VEAHPGLNGVALDDVDVPFKGLGDGEEGEHALRIAKDRRNIGKDRRNVGTSWSLNIEERSFVVRHGGLLRTDFLIGNLVNNNWDPPPRFFGSVDFKGR